jgi:hypothetical protein
MTISFDSFVKKRSLPDVNIGGVVGGPEYKLWRPVVAGADVRHVRLPAH